MFLSRYPKGAVIKACILALFLASSIIAVRFGPVGNFLTEQELGASLKGMESWAPMAFMLVYTLGICLFVPASILVVLGAALFGAYWGFLYAWLGSMAGSSLAFLIGRYLGRDLAAAVAEGRLKKYDDAIEKSGFSTVLYLRLACMPFTALNFGMGLTKVRFSDFFWGTALGIVVVTFAITLLVGTIKEAWACGQWDPSLSWKVPTILSLFALSCLTPKIIKKFQNIE